MIEAITDMFVRGGAVMWVIAVISTAGLSLVVERWFYYAKVDRDTKRFLSFSFPEAVKGKLPQSYPPSPIAQILMTGLIHIKRTPEEVEALMRETALGELPKMERNLSTIAVIGSILPLLGLLGTVIGMISTFEVISSQGTGDPKLMAGGISQALITTQAGLATAIPFIFLHSYLTNTYNRLVGLIDKETTRILTIARSSDGG